MHDFSVAALDRILELLGTNRTRMQWKGLASGFIGKGKTLALYLGLGLAVVHVARTTTSAADRQGR